MSLKDTDDLKYLGLDTKVVETETGVSIIPFEVYDVDVSEFTLPRCITARVDKITQKKLLADCAEEASVEPAINRADTARIREEVINALKQGMKNE